MDVDGGRANYAYAVEELIMMGTSRRSNISLELWGFKASRKRRLLQRRGLRWKEQILRWRTECTYQAIQPNLLENQELLPLLFRDGCGQVSGCYRELVRGDVDDFRERWGRYFWGVFEEK